MYGVCRRFAGQNLEADDIFQEGFVRVFLKLKQFRFQGPLEAWLRQIFINTAITLAKKEMKASNREPLREDLLVESDALDGLEKLSLEEVLQLIHELPAGYRTVFNLFVIEGYSHKEIGKKLGISENTSKSQLFGAKRCLRLKLTEYRNSNGRE
ncbi:MAG: sigma-70 family RNA polymerase sigma factor [Bacteroidales bacterium]|nr:sigma-70 family RNA polymerase sigma factor [Bacteroidales bacterium]